MPVEKRKHDRTDVFLIIDFRLVGQSHGYSTGISRNYSDIGLSVETHHFDYKPGQVLECMLKHPERDSSVSVLGEIVWKRDSWYDAVMGIKFLHRDERDVKAIHELAADSRKESVLSASEDRTFGRQYEDYIQSLAEQAMTSRETVADTLPGKQKIQEQPHTLSSKKRPASYLWFIAFLALSTVIIVSVAIRDGKDILQWRNVLPPDTDNGIPAPNEMTVSASTVTIPAVVENYRALLPHDKKSVEKSRFPAAPHDTPPPRDVIRDEITFEANSADIPSKFYTVIDKVADILLSNPGLIVKLEGHTDNAGPELYNIDLSVRRAAAVKELLVHKGIRSSRITIICFGPSNPVAPNDIEWGREKNRRVEISIPLSES